MIRKNTAFLRQVVNQNENGNVAMWQHGTHRGCYFMKLGWSIRLPKSSVKREKKMFRVWFENAYFFTRKKGQTSSTWKKILKLLRKKTDAHIKNSTKKSGVTSDRNVYEFFQHPTAPTWRIIPWLGYVVDDHLIVISSPKGSGSCSYKWLGSNPHELTLHPKWDPKIHARSTNPPQPQKIYPPQK